MDASQFKKSLAETHVRLADFLQNVERLHDQVSESSGAHVLEYFTREVIAWEERFECIEKRAIGKAAEMKPQRIQQKRTKGWRKPPNTICVGRGNGLGRFGNPFTGDDAARRFDDWINGPEPTEHREHWHKIRNNLDSLVGMNLACWCALDSGCHADVLLKLANKK